MSVHPPPVPALSAHQTNTTTSSSLMMEPRKYNRTGVIAIFAFIFTRSHLWFTQLEVHPNVLHPSLVLQTESNDYREAVDRVEVIKLPAHSTNGSVLSAPTSYTTTNANNSNDSDAPLNLSLKPATTSSSSPISGSQPLSQLSNLSQSLLASDRTCKCAEHLISIVSHAVHEYYIRIAVTVTMRPEKSHKLQLVSSRIVTL